MLNFVYWPISAILWFWHKLLSYVLDPGWGITWVLSIVLLTFTIRVFLVKPSLNQMRSSRKMSELQPRMAEIRSKYKNDQQKEMGVNPIAGCLPLLVQMPVFLGLFHVLRSFNRTGTGSGQLGLSVEQNRNTANYIFSPSDVQSFLDARLFGVPLSSYISMPESMYQGFSGAEFTRTDIMMVAIPLILITATATHFVARMGVNRQKARLASGKQSAPANDQMQMQMDMMNRMMVWFMPLTILFTGAFWHIGLLFYMVSNNIWTFFQQRFIFNKMDAEEEAEIQAKKDTQRASAPKPGVKPNNPKKNKKRRS